MNAELTIEVHLRRQLIFGDTVRHCTSLDVTKSLHLDLQYAG